MSKVKYRVREYIPKTENQGTHSWFAEVVINNDVDNAELARKIAARTGFKSYECQAVVAAIADIVAEEVLESNPSRWPTSRARSWCLSTRRCRAPSAMPTW